MSKILTLGNDLLHEHAQTITEFNDELQEVIDDMIETMHDGNGIGLAGPQIGLMKRIFVVQPDDEVYVFINPEIIWTSQEVGAYEEGCLSIPGVYYDVDRPLAIEVQAQKKNGRYFKLKVDGILARVIQHELDHLNGVLFIDHLDEKAKEKVVNQYNKRKRM